MRSQVGQVPFLDKWLGKNPWFAKPGSPIQFPNFGRAAAFCFGQLMERLSSQDSEKGNGPRDFLQDFLRAKDEFPEVVGDNEVIGYLLLNVSVYAAFMTMS